MRAWSRYNGWRFRLTQPLCFQLLADHFGNSCRLVQWLIAEVVDFPVISTANAAFLHLIVKTFKLRRSLGIPDTGEREDITRFARSGSLACHAD